MKSYSPAVTASLCCFLWHLQVDSLPGGRQQPFYRVLVDVRDRSPPQTTYVAQVGLNEHKVQEMMTRACVWHCKADFLEHCAQKEHGAQKPFFNWGPSFSIELV